MPRFKKGDMWSAFDSADLFLITTNSTIKRDGSLVMGRGIAKQARDRFKGLDFALGQRIKNLSTYGLLISENWPESKLGAFQTKWHSNLPSNPALVGYSIGKLEQFIADNSVMNVHLNFPGIGYGGLDKELLLRTLAVLPNNVYIWEGEKA